MWAFSRFPGSNFSSYWEYSLEVSLRQVLKMYLSPFLEWEYWELTSHKSHPNFPSESSTCDKAPHVANGTNGQLSQQSHLTVRGDPWVFDRVAQNHAVRPKPRHTLRKYTWWLRSVTTEKSFLEPTVNAFWRFPEMWMALFGMTQRLLLGSCKLIWTEGGKVKVAERTGWGICLVALLGRQRPGEWAVLLEAICAWDSAQSGLAGGRCSDSLVCSVIPLILSCESSSSRCPNGFKCLTHAHTILIGLVLSLREKEERENESPHPLAEKAMTPHSSTLAWKIPWTQESGRLQSMGSLRVRQDWATSLSLFTFMHWRRQWQPTPVFLPGESQGRQSLVGCSLWGRRESDMTETT